MPALFSYDERKWTAFNIHDTFPSLIQLYPRVAGCLNPNTGQKAPNKRCKSLDLYPTRE